MPIEALQSLLPYGNWTSEHEKTVIFSNTGDPVLPTPYRIATAGAATLAATGLAVSDLWETRTGRRQTVGVDLRQATASLRSGHYLKIGHILYCDRRRKHNSIVSVSWHI